MLWFINKVTIGTENLVLFIWDVGPGVFVAAVAGLGVLAITASVLDISDIMKSFDYDKLSSISPLISGKLKDLPKLLKHFNATTSMTNVLLPAGVLPIILVFYSKDSHVTVFLLSILLLPANYFH